MWPNETAEYREKRDALLAAEHALRSQVETVAKLRRNLPQGGVPAKDYEFLDARDGSPVRLSELFAPDKNTLLLYNLMYSEEDAQPCVMCGALLDSLQGAAPHVADRTNLAVIAKASPAKITTLADQRGWKNLRFLSSGNNTYNVDYGAESEAGNQLPMLHVWTRNGKQIHHFWGSELFFSKDPDWTNHPRHLDMIWPLWNLLDLTPDGRGGDWHPKNAY